MLDFSEIPEDGNDFELLTRELLFRLGYHVAWSGKGPDGGKDLLCTEVLNSMIMESKRVWLVQCKHFAHSGKSVGISDLDNVVDSCSHHRADGYLLVCSTSPSSKVVERLESITANDKNHIAAAYWDAAHLERMLGTPRTWGVAQTYMPKSSKASSWQVYATDRPNHWIVVHKDLYVHVHNRIGSHVYARFDIVQQRLKELDAIRLPAGHFFALRAIYYDDKNGNYTWYLDYMRPHGEESAIDVSNVKEHMREGWGYDDGQCYEFDILKREYHPYSDHYDRNHYEYYSDHIGHYMTGIERPKRYYDL